MRIFVWLVRAAIFFALFAFALNNQHDASVKWFFGHEWRAPTVFIVLGAFVLGCAFGVLAMVPSWWRHRRVARRHRPEPALPPAAPPSRRWQRRPCPRLRHAMDFDPLWLLFGLPVAFALGWLASRIDLRQWKREQRESPQAYFKGLNLLLNEQQDKAIDAFIEAVQQDPNSTDLHFALGNLFRRRGEYERAVRVHEHLLQRADLPAALRERAQDALAQDFMKAGLFDRAEQAYRALEGSRFDTDAQLALLSLYERSRDWRAAIAVAGKLERSGTASFASRIAHYWCEIAEEADARQQGEAAADALRQARLAAPQAARPLVIAGRRLARLGDHAQALQTFGELRVAHPAAFNLVARDHVSSALTCGQQAAARELLESLYRLNPSTDLLAAIALLDPDPSRQRSRLRIHLREQPALSPAQHLLALGASAAVSLDVIDAQVLGEAVGRAAKPLQRYRCAGCGFEAQHHFWQCPGCMAWDSYPPQRLEDL